MVDKLLIDSCRLLILRLGRVVYIGGLLVGLAARPSLGARVGQGSGVKKLEHENDGDHKVKYENGAKIKRESDGSVKIKRADGTKIKIDEDGHKTVKKGLF